MARAQKSLVYENNRRRLKIATLLKFKQRLIARRARLTYNYNRLPSHWKTDLEYDSQKDVIIQIIEMINEDIEFIRKNRI
jgi:hypothetical protein